MLLAVPALALATPAAACLGVLGGLSSARRAAVKRSRCAAAAAHARLWLQVSSEEDRDEDLLLVGSELAFGAHSGPAPSVAYSRNVLFTTSAAVRDSGATVLAAEVCLLLLEGVLLQRSDARQQALPPTLPPPSHPRDR